MSSSYTSSSSYSYSSSTSSSSNGGEPTRTGFQAAHQSYTDPSGTTSERGAYQNLGEPAQGFTRQTDAEGRELVGGGGNESGRITSGGEGGERVKDVTDEEAQANARYEEAMEDEYAKREGGA